jgi:F-type H+-transporting ATPase subunit gamma
MEQVETLKKTIESTKDVQSVVRTMKALAVANMRQFERAVRSVEAYNRTVEMGLQVVLRHMGDMQQGEISRTRPQNRRLGVILYGSAHGMCGQFNQQLVSYGMDRLDRVLGEGSRPSGFLVIGERALGPLQQSGGTAEKVIPISGSLLDITSVMQEVLMEIQAWRFERKIDRVVLFYNRPRSKAAYRSVMTHLLPVFSHRLERIAEKRWPSRVIPTFTMEGQRVFSMLIRHYLFAMLYRAFVDSMASENAARMSSMQAAERNIDERLEELERSYNQQRQTAITMELLDIIGGIAALEGSNY